MAHSDPESDSCAEPAEQFCFAHSMLGHLWLCKAPPSYNCPHRAEDFCKHPDRDKLTIPSK
jgi:hypothetical protein